MSVDGSENDFNIAVLIGKQKLAMERMKKMRLNYGKDTKTRKTKQYIKNKLETLQEEWESIRYTQQNIMREFSLEDCKLDYFKNDLYGEIRELYVEFISELEHFREENFGEQAPNTTPLVNNNERERPKLPTITIPKFNGDYQCWTSFYDLFVTLIHNNDQITDVQKLYYLKTHLTDEAANLLRHVTVTDANYQAAWQTLIQRYENKRVLVNTQLKTLLSQKSLAMESPEGIKGILDTTFECLKALQNLGLDTRSWDAIIIFITTQKLPSETHQSWEQSISNSKELPTVVAFKEFLEARFRTLEAIGTTTRSERSRLQLNKNHTTTIKTFHNTTQIKCCLCSDQHNIRQCPKYEQMDSSARLRVANNNGLCHNCLTPGHTIDRCYSKKNCKLCAKRHHHLLHENRNHNILPNKNGGKIINPSLNSTDQSSSMMKTNKALHCNISTNILLATALIRVSSQQGTHVLRALLDQGSQTSFITEAAVQILGLPKDRILASITGIGHELKTNCKGKVKLDILSCRYDKSITIEALVLKNITNLIPNTPIIKQYWPHLEGLTLADPNFMHPGKIDILLGADIYADILLKGLKRGKPNDPIAQNTIFGWILSGKTTNGEENLQNRIKLTNFHNKIELDNILKTFWELEEVSRPKLLSEEDKQCEVMFVRTHSRDSNGRYIVNLPFKEGTEISNLGKSRHIAKARFGQIERRFYTDTGLKVEYSKCLNEYLKLKHMKPLTETERKQHINSKDNLHYASYYLPHHPVWKEESTTTKLRVVFNASQPTDNGISLNDLLLTGPTIQDELKTIILRWRLLKYVYSADIEKMYRQVNVHREHQKFQKLLWREDPNEEIQDYCLTRLTFGFTSAAFLAIRSMQQLAYDEGQNFPLANHILRNDFYVDNVLSGADTLQGAINQKEQLISLLHAGGFPLRKWSSNHSSIISDLPDEYKEVLLHKDFGGDDNVKTLGLHWNPKEDYFIYKVSLKPAENCITKRKVASIVAKIFDPIGWCAPIIIIGKIILQDLWLIEVDWDTELPPNVVRDFLNYQKSLQDINHIKIPRWIRTVSNSSYEIHGFCDASSKAYSAVIYVKLRDKGISQRTVLLTASTKVAPIKTISIPRLELCGALLLARILKHTNTAMALKPSAIYAWTDSSIVLSWLNSHPNKWKCFVANRVTEIKNLTAGTTWQHIPSEENPADCASRGLTPEELIKHDLWWTGPKWLQQKQKEWPMSLLGETLEEIKDIKSLNTHIEQLPVFITKFSRLKTLIHVTAYMIRFTNRCRKKHLTKQTFDWLSPSELESAFDFLVKKNQYFEFAEEIRLLQRKKNLPRSSKLTKLHPFLDQKGLLRVGGRIQQANIPYEGKHPLILNNKSFFTDILIRHTHTDILHGGPQLTLHTLRQKFWIFKARNTVRNLLNKCVTCIKQKERTEKQLMGSLPKPRITQSRPFSHTGVDYCGPFSIRLSKGRGTKSQKCYISIFICMAVKAIHIELVTDLSTQGFLAAFRRFVSRRGLPSDVYSDCGTNFIGASRILDKDLHQIVLHSQNGTAAIMANEAVNWHFNPPAAPNFGGLWEAGVKSTKYHMKRILNDRLLTYEEMNTVLVQIEGILNSRPISSLTNDIEDLTALTPGHFLIGAPIKSIPESSLLNINENRLTRWQLLQQMNQNFWKLWHQEYLHQLQQRNKWDQVKENIAVGDLVLIKETNLSPNKWLLGRVVRTHPGADLLSRVLDIKTKKWYLKKTSLENL